MRSDQAERVADLFKRATELGEEDRSRFLQQQCGADPALRAEVESLLKQYDQAGNFLETAAIHQVAGSIGTDASRVGEIISNYEILSLIGHGGMGDVYLARDRDLQRLVALKIIRRGMDSEDIIRRFRQEERVLASLNHPNIAQLYGGGITGDGVPYFAMEYVAGKPIDDFCNERQMAVGERLQLFRKVCAAVHYAHQHLIVHRDIKPSNILVTGEGEPKLLDFGIGKLLEADSANEFQTLGLAPILTPEYASPEHARGEAITTASDTYSLGILLYELLTGQRPYRIRTQRPDEVARIITEQNPVRPSTALKGRDSDSSRFLIHNSRVLRGDLDNIVLMAMRKEPERRYSSAGQFSEDIRRHLEGLPVRARKDTLAYRSGKFISRHKVAVAAAVLILCSLIAGLIGTLWQARHAAQERALAEQRFEEVRGLAHSLMFDVHDSVANLAGSTPTRQLIVSRALQYLDTLARGAGDRPDLQRELASAYEKIGDIQGNPYSANLGDSSGALTSYRKALAIRKNLGRETATPDAQIELGRTYRAIGDILEQKGDVTACIDNYRQSLAIFRQLATTNDSFAVQDELARAFETLGDGLARAANSRSERLQSYQQALSIRQRLLSENPAERKLRRSVGLSFLKVGAAIDTNTTEAAENARHAVEILGSLANENPDDVRARREVGFAYYELGNILFDASDYAGALESRKKSFEIRREIAANDPKNAQATFDLAVAYADLSAVLVLNDEVGAALQHAQAGLKIFEQLCAADPSNVIYRRNLALSYEKLAQAYAHLADDIRLSPTERTKNWSETRNWYKKAKEVFVQLRTEGSLMPADAQMPEQFAAKEAAAVEALNQLKTSPAR